MTEKNFPDKSVAANNYDLIQVQLLLVECSVSKINQLEQTSQAQRKTYSSKP